MTSKALAFDLAQTPRWQEIADAEGIKVWARDVEHSDIRELKATVVLDASIEKVWDIINNTTEYPKFMPYILEARYLNDTAEEIDTHYEYHVTSPPLVSKRDMVLKVKVTKNPMVYTREWNAVSDKGPAPSKEIIRMPISVGKFTLKRLENNKTLLIYWMHSEPGGQVAAWITNNTGRNVVIHLLEALRMQVAP